MTSLLLFFLLQVNAKSTITKKSVELNSQKVIEIHLSNPKWNTDATHIDTGVVILRDSETKKVLQILLEETGPNTGIFSGTYSVYWGGNAIKPEVYVLDQNHIADQKELKSALEKIDSGELKRRPLFYRKGQDGVQTLQVFNSKEEMLQALELIRLENRNASGFDTSSITSPELGTAKAIMTTDELKQFVDANHKRKKDEQKRSLDRFRQEEEEKARIQDLKKQAQAASSAEKEKRERQANEYAEAALDFYRAGNYTQAEQNFRKSYELNPSDTKHYFQYGMSLFKDQKYNDAIIAFDISKSDKQVEKESLYYKGLSEYNLKEYELALQDFDNLEKTKDEQFAPLGSFYSGIIYYDQKQYEKAKEKFQIVLDTSKDPKLDAQAEKYIDNANRALQLAENRQKKVFLSATLGSMYDSNVLLQNNSSADQGSASGKGSMRYIFGIGAYYRPIMNDKYEFGPKFRTDYILTQNTNLTGYDPLSVQLSFPFAYKTTFEGKPTKIDVRPGYELLYLGETEHGHPLKTLNGKYIEVAPTVVMKDTWLTTLSLLYRKDSFYPEADQGENANKVALTWTNTLITNAAKTKSVIIGSGFTKNDATDSSYSYSRYDLNALYMAPTWRDDLIFAVGPGFYYLNYSSPNTEHDFNTVINATLSKQLTKVISGTILTSYVVDSSNIDSSKYNKWTLGILFNADYGF